MINISWDVERESLKLVVLGNFLAFYPPKNPKNEILKKWKKLRVISSFYTCVTKISIIWYIVLEIRSETEFFVILGHFLPYYFSNDQENQNFQKRKKLPGDVILLHMCAINDDHMMYGSWDMEHDRFFLSFWTIFCPFTLLRTRKIKPSKKWKKHVEILTFYTCVP